MPMNKISDLKDLPERFKNLPSEVQSAIASVDTLAALQEIALRHKIQIDELELLCDEVVSVMLGLVHPKDLGKNLQSQIQVTLEEAAAITHDIDEQIFKPIRASLMQMSMEENTEDIIAERENSPSRDTVLQEIENPSRIIYKTEPIELELPAPSKQIPTPVREVVGAETLAELPPSLRPATPASATTSTPVPIIQTMPTTMETAKIPAPAPSAVNTVIIPSPTPEKETVSGAPEQKSPPRPRVDPYREPV